MCLTLWKRTDERPSSHPEEVIPLHAHLVVAAIPHGAAEAAASQAEAAAVAFAN